LLRKSNHLTNFGLSSEDVLATALPYLLHHSPSLSPITPSKSLLILSVISYRNTGDVVGTLGHPVCALGHPVGALGHPVRRSVVAYFEADLWKMYPKS